MTIAIRVVPLPSPIADEARRTGRSPGYGHPAHVELATGYGPCRQCLRRFRAGEERRLLFTFDAFAGLSTYPQPGPIFIHEEPCAPWDAPGAFPDELKRWKRPVVRVKNWSPMKRMDGAQSVML